jgi:acetyl-CoA carboxylase carboxyl transferase beta subunit
MLSLPTAGESHGPRVTVVINGGGGPSTRARGGMAVPGPRLQPMAPPGSVTCRGCARRLLGERFERHLRVCPGCGHHARVPSADRLRQLADPGSTRPVRLGEEVPDPLRFDDGTPYPARVAAARAATGVGEVLTVARAALGGTAAVLACMEFEFLGGSLGSAAGEAFARACEIAVAERRALVAVCASGGARMQEGIVALAQMGRCTIAVAAVADAGLPYLAVLTDPCFGGVTASFATQADVILAEPGARIGFAGGRVIEQAAGDRLPAGFQTAEFLLAHGMVDAVVPRRSLRPVVIRLLDAYSRGRRRNVPELWP